MKIKTCLIICGFFLITSCIPDVYDYPDEGDWLEPGLPHAIAMHSGDADNGTYQFFEFTFASQVDKGVSYDRRMSQLMTYPPPGLGMSGKWTVFVLRNQAVHDMSLAYFGHRLIQSGANTVERRRQSFKLYQYYFIVGEEYRAGNLPSRLIMDNGFEISVSGTTLTGADGNTVNIISADNMAFNGIFHVIDGPLHPTNPADFQYIDVSYFYEYGSDLPDKEGWNPYQ